MMLSTFDLIKGFDWFENWKVYKTSRKSIHKLIKLKTLKHVKKHMQLINDKKNKKIKLVF